MSMAQRGIWLAAVAALAAGAMITPPGGWTATAAVPAVAVSNAPVPSTPTPPALPIDQPPSTYEGRHVVIIGGGVSGVALGSGLAASASANIASTDDTTLLTGAAAAALTGTSEAAIRAAAVRDTAAKRFIGLLQFLRRRNQGARSTLANHFTPCQTEVKQSRRVTGANCIPATNWPR
ncbi:MAG TPA: hypothetical protein PLE12_11135 [Propionicimonas sp.]|nr:hypothetical protein [Propionicimonas sp.]